MIDLDRTPISQNTRESDEDDMVGPAAPDAGNAGAKKKKGLQFESVYLDNMPKADMYEKSYMHRDEVNHVLVTPKYGILITGQARPRFARP
jgi:peptidylprolyl isomerase domain and WD repeat-containing protein 1